jgi:hypothetical protein
VDYGDYSVGDREYYSYCMVVLYYNELTMMGRKYMYLFVSIILSTTLGYLLLMIGGPIFGGFIAFGIVVGCLFRGLYLLSDIQNRLATIYPKEDKVQKAYKEYIETKNVKD